MAAKKELGNAIDRVVRHYKDSRKKIAVPEWDLDVYHSLISYADLEAMGAGEGAKEGDVFGANVDTLIFKGEDKDGNKLFRAGDRAHLMANADAGIVNRIVRSMNGISAKKKSETGGRKESRSDSD